MPRRPLLLGGVGHVAQPFSVGFPVPPPPCLSYPSRVLVCCGKSPKISVWQDDPCLTAAIKVRHFLYFLVCRGRGKNQQGNVSSYL